MLKFTVKILRLKIIFVLNCTGCFVSPVNFFVISFPAYQPFLKNILKSF